MDIVLVGNPNVGKSVIFNSLTGRYVTVSNYPGTTVEISKGKGRFRGHDFTVVDTPGINSLDAHSEDEKVTLDILSRSASAAIVQVVDSKNLKRSLLLTLELLRLKLPLVLNLNMADEMRERGIKVDTKKLSDKLGIEVVETIAITGEGIPRLREAISKAVIPSPGISKRLEETDALAGDSINTLKRRIHIVDNLAADVMTMSPPPKGRFTNMLGRMASEPATGIPILLAILVFMYLFVGKFAAGTLVDFFENVVFDKIIDPPIIYMVNKLISVPWMREILIGDYGVITMALAYAFAIILPIVSAFFLLFGVLEDSGYLPRLSVLSDRVFGVIGLNGRAILPMVLGLGCGTMATLTTRILDTKKERILASLLLTLAIPCSAQLGVMMGMLGNLSIKALIIWTFVLILVMAIVGFSAARIIPGSRSPFIQEIPPMRVPQVKNILVKTFARLKWYIKEAVPLFILGTLILFVSDKTGILRWLENILSPLVTGLLDLPTKATEAFIMGFLRRDYGAAGLYVLSKAGQLDRIQVVVSLVVITLFVPCVAQFFVTVKERGLKIASLIGAFVFIAAFFTGGALNYILRFLLAKGIAVV